MKEITFDEVKEFLANNTFKFKPCQEKISYPIITRIHRRLQEGHSFSNIKVANDVINDGHHRFVCLSLLGMDIDCDPAGENVTKAENREWHEVILDPKDHDTEAERKKYQERYDVEPK